MIPLSKESRYEYKDPNDGTIFLLKFVTDAERVEFQKEAKKVRECVTALSRMQKNINKLSEDGQEDLPQELVDEIKKIQDQLYDHQKWVIDFFVVGWKNDSDQLPELTGRPSSFFKVEEVPKLANAIQNLYPVLTGLSVSEAKN